MNLINMTLESILDEFETAALAIQTADTFQERKAALSRYSEVRTFLELNFDWRKYK